MFHENDRELLSLFRRQVEHNLVYREYLSAIGCDIGQVRLVQDIPFLPIALFKTHDVRTGSWESERTFLSSGTTGSVRSRHSVRHVQSYLDNARRIFESEYFAIHDTVFLALLPGYAPKSSLVTMVDHFIQISRSEYSGFFDGREHFKRLAQMLRMLKETDEKVVLIGVTHALLDFAEVNQVNFPNLIIIETGGMKGRGEEVTRSEVHEILKLSFGVDEIHSEYGMTELQSQAYSHGKGIFQSNEMLTVLPGDMYDPLSLVNWGQTCRLLVLDRANSDTCAFIATEDIGRVWSKGHFEVLGRLDHSDIRGCNLLAGS